MCMPQGDPFAMSHETKPVVPGQEARIDRGMLKILCIILMFVFAVGIGLFGAVSADAIRGGHWTGF